MIKPTPPNWAEIYQDYNQHQLAFLEDANPVMEAGPDPKHLYLTGVISDKRTNGKWVPFAFRLVTNYHLIPGGLLLFWVMAYLKQDPTNPNNHCIIHGPLIMPRLDLFPAMATTWAEWKQWKQWHQSHRENTPHQRISPSDLADLESQVIREKLKNSTISIHPKNED